MIDSTITLKTPLVEVLVSNMPLPDVLRVAAELLEKEEWFDLYQPTGRILLGSPGDQFVVLDWSPGTLSAERK